jgi:hypothetical protein
MANNMPEPATQDARKVFSISTTDVGNRHAQAKAMDVTVARFIRHDLCAFEELLHSYEVECLKVSSKNTAYLREIVSLLSTSQLCRLDKLPSMGDIRAYLSLIRHNELSIVLEHPGPIATLQVAWLVFEARKMAAGGK